MNVLMIYPKFPDETFWNYTRSLKRFSNWKASMPPLGLLTVAGYLPPDFNVRLIDRSVAEESDADWRWADVIFLSAMLGQLDDYSRCVAAARSWGKPVAVGGPFTHAVPELAAANAEWVCFGEAEDIMDELVRDLRADIRGKQYHGGSKTDMTAVRLPRYDLLPQINDYVTMPVQFSRGCPFTCEFCDIIEIYGRVPRTKNPEQVLTELDFLRKLGFHGAVFLVDDNFIGHKKSAKLMLKALAAWSRENRYPYRFFTEASFNLADDEELLDGMARANFFSVFIGIETTDATLLKTALKRQNIPGNPLQKLNRIREYGIDIMGGFVLGFDGEDHAVFDAQRSFIEASGIGIVQVTLLQAVPHTGLARRLQREGRLLEGFAQGPSPEGIMFVSHINFVPKGTITKREYLEAHSGLMRALYTPENYFRRILPGLLKLRVRTPRRAQLEVWAKYGTGFFRQAYHFGIKSKLTRRHYWPVFFRVLLKNPAALEAFAWNTVCFAHLNQHAENIGRESTAYLASPSPGDVLDEVV